MIRDTVSARHVDSRVEYRGDGWSLYIDPEAGWHREAGRTETLRLTREADGAELVLRLRAYAVREGISGRTFLAAHAMWLAEEDGPRIEYSWDHDEETWHGYCVADEREVYYAFKVVGDRAYVLEESAANGVLAADAADEFERICADFECAARDSRGQATTSANGSGDQ